ncbi:MAG TPA: phosphate ABC transporter permease PstA [Pilimelia sp.]|nr:phosphate ABC transporter permease PstA [Pilimelia sp.]
MSVVSPGAGAPNLSSGAISGRRRFSNHLATAFIALSVILAVIPLALVCYYVLAKGASVVSWEFLSSDVPRSPRREGGGIWPAIVGTLLITGAAALMAIPLGVLGAVYLNEYGKNRPLARVIRTMADVMTGVPSIVMGLFIYVAWVTQVGSQSGFAGALALGCLMLPIVIRTTEEILRLVPDDLRQASAALGARRWRTTVTVVLPAAVSGITSGAMLAVARAAGETAPLLATIGLVYTANYSLMEGNTALPMLIFRNAAQPFDPAQQRAWGAALALVVIVVAFTIIARVISSRFAIKDY